MPTTAYTNVSSSIQNLLPSGSPAGITADNHRTVELALLAFAEGQWVTGDIKEVDCTQAYILDPANFEQTGPNKGKGTVGGPREGWAICNGNNGTRNRTGRVSVAWGDLAPLGAAGEASTQPNIGGTGPANLSPPVIGGQKDAVVVSHTHTLQFGVSGTAPTILQPSTVKGDADGDNILGQKTVPSPTGSVLGTDKNMQPYIVTLFIQKL